MNLRVLMSTIVAALVLATTAGCPGRSNSNQPGNQQPGNQGGYNQYEDDDDEDDDDSRSGRRKPCTRNCPPPRR